MNIPTGNQADKQSGFALFNLSFRIFFLSAGIFSIITMALWAAVYLFNLPLEISLMGNMQWHAHEMIYGYAMAAITGFLLTAARNWTGVATLHGKPLAGLFLLWAIARLLFLAGAPYIKLAAVTDILFGLTFIAALSYPIVKVRQWKQLAIVSKVLLLVVFNILFYLGAIGQLSEGIRWGLFGGLYLVISLILTLGRRVVPFFIERGVDQPVTLRNSRLLDLSSMALFLLFTLLEVFFQPAKLTAYLAFFLFIINAIRLYNWYTPQIWQKSLLWSLYLGLGFITAGFLLFALSRFFHLNPFLAIHSFAVGGIGLMTVAMMARVSLGHSGRSIHQPPKTIPYAFALLVTAAVIRVFLPIIEVEHYTMWVAISQLLWLLAFGLFSLAYLPILSKPRIDGQPG